ncbi:amino acid adenylation domain-containing protein [Streptomyces sp. NPDC026673]|uniref:amino acid adenylation domain-containing protein n=1 Tax=Streptomyces sp. NPDC026673 TaxID=3155724 RepID=UPI0033D0E94B
MQHNSGAGSVELTGPKVKRDCPTGLPGLIRDVAERHPDRPAVRSGTETLSYGQLDAWSDAIARTLRDRAPEGVPVVVAVPRGNGLLAALLGVLKAGLPYLPVDPNDPPARLASVLETAGSRLALVGGEAGPVLTAHGLRTVEVDASRVAADFAGPGFVADPLPRVADDQPVYVLFTSGSTGAPKGVVLPGMALCNRLLWMRDTYGIGPGDRILQKTPVTFDVSGWELWLPLISGATCVFLPPEEHRDPALVARAVQEHRITVCHFVPSMLREFLRGPGARECTSLRHVFCSGEALPVAVARDFTTNLTARLHNLYGPTEAAIDVTHWTCPRETADIDRILIGLPVDNCVLGVFGGDGKPVPTGEEGELRIGGMPLALGYLNRPDLTERAFVPADAGASVPVWYRTGDRVRVVDGGLEYLGRVDDQVKIRGQRIEPQEVEHHLNGHPEVAEGTVVAAKVGEDVELVAWVRPAADGAGTQAGDGLPRRLREHLADRVPPAYVPTRFLIVTELPLSSSGKRDRKLLRQRAEEQLNARRPASRSGQAGGGRPLLQRLMRERSGRTAASAEEDDPDAVASIWYEVLPQAADVDDPQARFVALGGHSLLGARVAAEIHHRLGVSLPLGYFLRNDPTLAELRAAVAAADRPADLPEVPAGPVAAAPGQRRMWLLSEMFPDSPAYNVVGALRIHREIEREPLSAAVTAVARRHPMLGAALHDDGSELLLTVDPSSPSPVTVERGAPGEVEAFLRRNRDTVLDPQRGPLYRVAALNTGDGTAVLTVALHHAIADQRTLDVLLEELAAEYARASGGEASAAPAFPAAADYRQYAALQSRRREATVESAVDYWRTALTDAPAAGDLPFALPPVAVPTFTGDATAVTLDEEDDRAVRDLAVRAGCTPAMVFLTAAALVLARWSSRGDVVIGVAASARDRAEFQRTVGFFVDTVPVRLDVGDRPSLGDALERVREALARGVEHSAVPFDEVVAALRPSRTPLGNPYFQTWFNDLSEATAPGSFAGAPAEPVEVPVGWSLFDLGFYLHRDQGRYRLQVVHAQDRYERDVALAALDQWRSALRAMTRDLASPVTGFGGAAPATAAVAPTTERVTVGEMVDGILARAGESSEAPAVIGPDGAVLGYGALRDAVLRCSAALSARVAPGATVAVVAHREPMLPVALLGAWHSGRPVLLLDAETPERWRQDAVDRMNAAAVLHVGPGGSPGEGTPEVPVLDVAELLDAAPAAPGPAAFHSDFSHALLTSGTTGEPSVVRVPADALATAFAWYAEELDLGPRDVFCALAGAGHDPVLREMVLPLTAGATVVVPSAAERFDPEELLQVLAERRCTVLNVTPGHAQLITAGGGTLPGVRVVSSYGAPLTDNVARALRRLAPGARLYNVYGTTETSQASSVHRWSEPTGRAAHRATVPVGTGTGYRTLEVVTSSGTPAGVGQLGEVVVRGAGLASGTEYRTGDLGRRTPEGDVEICGRTDRQVSVRGHRVEPAAVEAVLNAVPSVAQSAVGIHPDRPDVLVALVVPATGLPARQEAEERLRAHLPSWAVPEVVEVAAIPLNRNGKPDLGTLPAPAAPARPGQVAPLPARPAGPSGPASTKALQDTIAAAVRETCGRTPAPEQHFFDAGLTSLDMLRLHRRLLETAGPDLAVVTLFRFPTLASLAAHLAGRSGGADPATVPRPRKAQGELQTRRAIRDAFSAR